MKTVKQLPCNQRPTTELREQVMAAPVLVMWQPATPVLVTVVVMIDMIMAPFVVLVRQPIAAMPGPVVGLPVGFHLAPVNVASGSLLMAMIVNHAPMAVAIAREVGRPISLGVRWPCNRIVLDLVSDTIRRSVSQSTSFCIDNAVDNPFVRMFLCLV